MLLLFERLQIGSRRHFCEGERVGVNEEGGCDEKDADVPEEAMLAWPELPMKELPRAISQR